MDPYGMKIPAFVLMCLWALTLLYPPSLFAAQSASQVKVSVSPIDNLTVTDAAHGIQLHPVTPGSDLLIGDPDTSARLFYSHNSPVSKKITAQVRPENVPAGTQDITLHVTVAGGAEQVILSGGVAQGAKEILKEIPAGNREDLPVTYGAGATATGTRPGDYKFVVTFTSLDDN